MVHTDVKEVQRLLLELLKEIDGICQKNKIQYFADSGTLLGAVRHNGFIPWDDDIDLSVKRENLEKLIAVLRNDLSKKYELVLPTDYPNDAFFDQFIKVIIKGEYFVECSEESEYYGNKPNCISLDFLIIDTLSSNLLFHKFRVVLLKYIYSLCMGHRYKINYEKFSPLLKAAVKIQTGIGRRIPLTKLMTAYDKLSCCKKGDESLAMIQKVLPFMNRVFKSEWFEQAKMMHFEDTFIPVPNGYKAVLTELYGSDYMTPKPVSNVDNDEYQHIGSEKLFG